MTAYLEKARKEFVQEKCNDLRSETMSTAMAISLACGSVRRRAEWLDESIRKGGFITKDTLEAHDLNTAIMILTKLTGEIRQRRDGLLANAPQEYREAAE